MAAEAHLRAKRVGERMREELASLLSAEVKDPGASGVVLTSVEMTPDLRRANVKVRLLENADDRRRRGELVSALRRAAGMLRREVTHRLGLRYAPELHFFYDDGSDNVTRVEQLLAEIESERKGRG